MTLSARIVLRPSRRIAFLEVAMAAGGFAAAAVAIAARLPGHEASVGAVATLLVLGLATRLRRRFVAASQRTIVVGEHRGIGVVGDDRTWSLAEPSLAWPGFAIVALVADGAASPGIVVAVPDGALSRIDGRALHRFLVWSRPGGSR